MDRSSTSPEFVASDAGPAAVPAGPAGRLGSREHVRQTVERARAATLAARERRAHSHTVVARSEALAAATERVLHESAALRAQLRASVTAYVHHLKADGLPPERMLILVKSVVLDASPAALDVDDARRLMDDVVRWSVEAYYDAA